MGTTQADLEVDISQGDHRAIIEGKTTVSFQKFVQLVLQKKVTALFKDWGDNPVIIDSELLTSLASAQQDSVENKTHLILVTLGIGTLFGVFVSSLMQLALLPLDIVFTLREHAVIILGIAGLALLTAGLARMKRMSRADKLVDTMEKIANLLSK